MSEPTHRPLNESMATVGGLEICYESIGNPDDPPLLLVMGLGTQMIGWPDGFCSALAERGFHVIRYDNRDVGRSTHLPHIKPPTVKQLLLRDKSAAGYTLGDMAADGIGLLEALDLDAAHVVGASMGGMIAQTMAARYPERVRSLASIMSTTGHRWRGQPGLRVYPLFLRRPVRHRKAAVEAALAGYRLIGSPGFEIDEEHLRHIAGLAYDRGYNPAGSSRQLAAIIAAGDRTAEVRRITAPTVVIHGTKDRMVRPSGGRETHKAIAGSRMVWIHGLGHDMPRGAWPAMIDAIVENAKRARLPATA
jgi:pimeloyl-ACP methyl ester carboxylesterase